MLFLFQTDYVTISILLRDQHDELLNLSLVKRVKTESKGISSKIWSDGNFLIERNIAIFTNVNK